jgi:hypothetical protein
MDDRAKPVSRPWRTFLRFSVRGMIVLVLVVGVSLGWLVRSARIQREAVAAIKKAGGSVYYHSEWNDDDQSGSWAPTRTRVTDSGLRHLEGLSNLRELEVRGTSVTDYGTEKLRLALPEGRIER